MNIRKLGILFSLIGMLFGQSMAQTTSFTYQGELQFSSQPANGTFDFEFLLYDAASGGTQIGATETRSNITVTDGKFTVSLDFGANFTGPERFLEIRVRQSGGGGFTILDPRQRIGSSPYAVRSLAANTATTADTATNATNATNATTAATATNALNLGGIAADQYVLTNDPRMSDPRPPIGGSSAYIHNSTIEQANAGFNVNGTGRARILNATNLFQLNGNRILSTPGASGNLYLGILAGPTLDGGGGDNTFIGRLAGNSNAGGNANTFVGVNSGFSNTTGNTNTFFGYNSGRFNQNGNDNAFFGAGAGDGNTSGFRNANFGTSAGAQNNTGTNNSNFGRAAGFANIGSGNSVFGSDAGRTITNGQQNAFFGFEAATSLTTGNENSFFGTRAGRNVTTGTRNSFFGFDAGFARPGNNLTLIGALTATTMDNLSFATAIGAGATVSTSNTIVLGRPGGEDTVKIPGPFEANISFSSPVVNAATQFNLGGTRILGASIKESLYVGFNAGSSDMGDKNAFVGYGAGTANLFGRRNAFFGFGSGSSNQNGEENVFLGSEAGSGNTTGSGNIFIGSFSGIQNQTGNQNITIGTDANVIGPNLSYATAIGSGSSVTTNNTIVLGRSGGQDTVVVPGTASVNILRANTQFDLGNSRILFGSFANRNVLLGFETAEGLNFAANNTLIGFRAGRMLVDGNENVIIGREAGTNADANFNTLVGDRAGQNIAGTGNTFVGRLAGRSYTTASGNSFFGHATGNPNVTGTGTDNTFLGSGSGFNHTSGSSNTLVGADANMTSGSLSFATAIGAGSSVSTSNTIALGRSNGSDTVRVYGRLRLGLFGAPSAVPLCIDGGSSEITACSSSLRYKENIFDYTSGLSLIRRLRPVYFDWKHSGVRDFGLVAEEVAAVEPLLATTNKDGEIQGVNYERVGVVLVNAVNEQQSLIETQQRQINELLEANRRQQAQIEALTKLFCSANQAAGICREKP